MTLCLLLSLFAFAAGPQTPGAGSAPAAAPQHKMITYQLVILKKGPSAGLVQTPEGQGILKQHIAYMYKLGNAGTGMAAGPLLDDGEIQGILILKAGSPEEAREIESADPAVKAGIFTIEVTPFLSPEGWFGRWAEYGKFETVYFGFLNSGPNRGQDAEAAKRLQAEHIAYMEAQSKQGGLIVAGPFVDGGTRRGVVVYRTSSAEEARSRAEGDPAVKAGRLTVELHPWQVPQGALPR